MKIADICTRISSGGTPKSGNREYYKNGEIPWLNTKEINFERIRSTEIYITQEGFNSSSAKWVAPHAVIIAMYGATAGRAAISEIPLTTNQACCNLEIDTTKADYRYIYYWFKQHYSHIFGLANGGAQQNLSVKIIKELDIDLPELDAQRVVGGLLSIFDEKIDLNCQINGYLGDLQRTLFEQAITSAESPQISLNKIAAIKYGKGLPKTKLVDEGFPVYGGNGVIGFYNEYLYDNPQILIACRGAASGKIVIWGC